MADLTCSTCRIGFDEHGAAVYAPLKHDGKTWCCTSCHASHGNDLHAVSRYRALKTIGEEAKRLNLD